MSSSFIICTKNRPDELLDCVNSIIQQRLRPSEIIVIDASHPEIQCRNLCRLQDRFVGIEIGFIYRSVPHGNLPHQRNLGIDLSSGQLIFFLDDDVILSPSFHTYILDMYETYGSEKLGGIQGRSSDSIRSRWSELFWAMFMPEIGFRTQLLDGRPFALLTEIEQKQADGEPMYVQWMSGYCMSFPRSRIEQIRFDENLDGYAAAEDRDFTYRLSKRFLLLEAPSGHLIHRRTTTDRLSVNVVVEMVTVNNYYILCKTRSRHPYTAIHNCWALVGFLLRGVTFTFVRRNPGNLTGTLRGIARILRGDLPS